VIYLLETDGKTLSPVVAIDPTFAEEILATPLNLETSFTGKAVKTKRSLIFNDAAEDAAGQQIPGTPTEETERVIVAPFLVDDTVLGAMCLNRIGIVFSEEDLALAETFATYAATALHNAQTYDNLQRAIAVRERAEKDLKQSLEKSQRLLEQTVNVLASTVEMRDPYTAGHQRQVNKLACAIAEEMGLPEEQIDGIRMAALIHDIGKIYVPAEILSRPGELTETEFGLIKIHSQAGHDVLKPIEFPWPVAEIVLQHHERLNGSGFPQGLSGEEILLEARIIGVADVVEAMSSHRPYRPALGINKALEEISQNRGVLYDPQVVDVCLKVFSENGFKFA
jgi:putative nucleotidyltransferase with HDIG domain